MLMIENEERESCKNSIIDCFVWSSGFLQWLSTRYIINDTLACSCQLHHPQTILFFDSLRFRSNKFFRVSISLQDHYHRSLLHSIGSLSFITIISFIFSLFCFICCSTKTKCLNSKEENIFSTTPAANFDFDRKAIECDTIKD